MNTAQASKASGLDLGRGAPLGEVRDRRELGSFASVFLQRQQALGFDPLDVNILLQLADH